ncbi:hypothetical protein [Streptomyces agglomeratus]|uniref:hypothetical protein n=2 Tax=Streptomyces agglomeratus TaxID=285458 RepID=UPI00269E49A7
MIRNAGGVITDDVIRSLAVSQQLLGTDEIILIHHTDCRMLTYPGYTLKEPIRSESGLRSRISTEHDRLICAGQEWSSSEGGRHPASCFRSVSEGCAMASVLGVLEERETAARVRVEGLREEVARLAGVLEAAEIELDRRVIAREELVEALAASVAGTTAVTEVEAERETAPAPVPGSIVPPWREGLPVTVLAPDYQRILGVLEERQSAGQGPLKAREITVGLGLETTPAKVEGVRSKARRLVERGWLMQETSGMFRAGRRPVSAPDAGPSA